MAADGGRAGLRRAAAGPPTVAAGRAMISEVVCPGCGLALPPSETAFYDGYFHASRECWSVFCEVMEAEFSNAVVFAAVHQLSVDAYAVQHAGGGHPDKSVGVHLSGLHLALEQGVPPRRVAPLLQRMSASIGRWPRFEPPADRGAMTVLEVAMAGSPEEHVRRAEQWARSVWAAWAPVHAHVAELVGRHLERRRAPA